MISFYVSKFGAIQPVTSRDPIQPYIWLYFFLVSIYVAFRDPSEHVPNMSARMLGCFKKIFFFPNDKCILVLVLWRPVALLVSQVVPWFSNSFKMLWLCAIFGWCELFLWWFIMKMYVREKKKLSINDRLIFFPMRFCIYFLFKLLIFLYYPDESVKGVTTLFFLLIEYTKCSLVWPNSRWINFFSTLTRSDADAGLQARISFPYGLSFSMKKRVEKVLKKKWVMTKQRKKNFLSKRIQSLYFLLLQSLFHLGSRERIVWRNDIF